MHNFFFFLVTRGVVVAMGNGTVGGGAMARVCGHFVVKCFPTGIVSIFLLVHTLTLFLFVFIQMCWVPMIVMTSVA